MVQTNNEEIGNLALPRWVSLQGTLLALSNDSVVALLVKARCTMPKRCIPCEARLEYDALEAYRISTRLFRLSLRLILYSVINMLGFLNKD